MRDIQINLLASLVHTPRIHGLWKHVFWPRVLGMKSQVISQSWSGIRIIGTKPIWRRRKSSKSWEIYKSSFISFIGAYTPNSWPVKTCFQTVSTRDEITVLHAGVFLKWSWRLMDHLTSMGIFFNFDLSGGEEERFDLQLKLNKMFSDQKYYGWKQTKDKDCRLAWEFFQLS